MWRRRRGGAQRGAGRPGTRSASARVGHWGSRRAWRMDRQAETQVALRMPQDYAQVSASAGAVQASVAQQTNGRLGGPMPSVFCTSCGEANPDGARFCARCGTPLKRRAGDRVADTTSTISIGGSGDVEADQFDEADADAAAVAGLPPGTALLAVRRGPNAGSRFLLDSDLTLVGRHPDSDIFLDDWTVSRRHAEFYRQRGGFTVRDVGSLNGTYVNRERIEEATLNQGDEVQVGKFRLVFLLGPGSPAEYGGGMRVGG
jgi:hypothetical protein